MRDVSGSFHKDAFAGSMHGAGPVYLALWCLIVTQIRPDATITLNPVRIAGLIGCSPDEVTASISAMCSNRLIRITEFEYRVKSFRNYQAGRLPQERLEQKRMTMALRRRRLNSNRSGKHA